MLKVFSYECGQGLHVSQMAGRCLYLLPLPWLGRQWQGVMCEPFLLCCRRLLVGPFTLAFSCAKPQRDRYNPTVRTASRMPNTARSVGAPKFLAPVPTTTQLQASGTYGAAPQAANRYMQQHRTISSGNVSRILQRVDLGAAVT